MDFTSLNQTRCGGRGATLLAALAGATAVAVAALAWAGAAGAMAIAPESAKSPCRSCQVDDPEASVATTMVFVSGRGYGHGIGMSQYGAYGMARSGSSFDRILGFYYPGTELGKAPVAVVRVLLADAASGVSISSAAPFVAIDSTGRRWTLPAGSVTLDTTLSLPVGEGGAVQPVAGPIVFKATSAALALGGKRFRGSLTVGLMPQAPSTPTVSAILAPLPTTATGGVTPPVSPAATAPAAAAPAPTTTAPATTTTTPAPSLTPPVPGALPPVGTVGPVAVSGLRVVNRVGLEAYLAGVIAREVPASWPAAALQAQAVAARSYALAHRAADESFDLYADERSQVYGGIAAEHPATTAAIRATAASVLLYAGRVADTLFSASNGGRTMSAAEAYPGNPDPPPYLAARDDPYDAAASPFASWGPVAVPAATIEAALGLPGTLVDLTVDSTGSARPTQALAITSSGQVRITPARLRAALGLRSSWVEIGVLSLARPSLPVSSGGKVTLNGLVRGFANAQLEQRAATGWTPLAAVLPGVDGQFTFTTKALASTDFRLSSATGPGSPVAGLRATVTPAAGSAVTAAPVTGGILSVPVWPRVKLLPALDLMGLSGVLKPAVAPGGSVIEIQFDGSGTDTSWNAVATATVGADGSFSATLPVLGGSYRAVLPAVTGLAAAGSTPVRITIPS